MIIVAAAIAAVLSVPLSGASLTRLATVSFRSVWLIWIALGMQVIITVVPRFPNTLGQPIHLLTFALAAVFMWSNRRLPGVSLVALGAGLNLVAVATNGGTMPASATAWRIAGLPTSGSGFENSNVIANARVAWLGDVFAIPKGWPLANVFSIGDVVVVIAISYFLHVWCRLDVRTSAAVAQ